MPEAIDAPSIVNETANLAWRPGDLRSRCDWAEENVDPPNSARKSKFSVAATPWLREPLDWSTDNKVREMVLMMPTGAGKTTVMDVIVPHAVAEDPGGILLVLQTDQDAKEYVEERMMPILRGVKSVAHIMATMGRHSIRGDAVMFPHMPLYMGGANLTNLQRKSVRYCLGDEVWRWKHGYVKELRARHHDRWNARVVLVSQGGSTHLETNEGMVQTEWDEAWMRTDRREWCYQCPECGEVQRYSWKCLRYDRGDPDAEIDETAIAESTSYRCAGSMLDRPTCDAVFTDALHIRRALANSGRYVVQHPRHLARHHGWHCNALTLYYVPWGQLAIEHAQAHRARKTGDGAPIRIFRQKRGAENVRPDTSEIDQSGLTIGDYATADYADGRKAEGEAWRFMSIDVQMDHYWVTVRVFRADGSSLRIFADRIGTDEQLREVQLRLGVDSMWVSIDSGHFTDRVYNLAAKWGWRAFKGDHAEQYKFAPPKGRAYHKFYSPMQTVCGSSLRPCKLILFSNINIKRILERLRNGPRPIPGTEEKTEVPRWEVEGDITETLKRHLYSETERDTISKMGKRSRAYVPIKAKEPNHTWDTEAHHVVFALIAGCLRYHPDDPAPEPNSPPQ